MAQHLIASSATLKAIKQGDSRQRISDGAGLYLLLFVKGGAHGWRIDYTHRGKRKTISLGTFPEVGLSEARGKAAQARRLVRDGVDPSSVRKAERSAIKQEIVAERRAAAGLPALDSFEAIAREWYERNAANWATSHAEKILGRLERDVFPWLGKVPVADIGPTNLLTMLQRIESRGAIETTHRVHQVCGQILRFAVATGRIQSDPSRDLRGALTPWKPEHYPTLSDPRDIGRLLRDISSYQGSFITRCALQLAPLLFVRPGELRRAEWGEFDLQRAEWRIPTIKMKGRVLHIVPLSRQVLAILHDLKPLTGNRPWLFPGNRTNGEPMSENTINAALRRLGYSRAQLTAHSFRSMASTMLHELGWPTDVIERQLAHAERNAVKAAYNHAEHLPVRRKLMQAWADHLDGLRKEAVPGPREACTPAGPIGTPEREPSTRGT